MSTRYGCSIGTFRATVRLRLSCPFFNPGLTRRMTRANNERPASTSCARWTKIVCPAVSCSRQRTRASPGESGRRTRRWAAGLGDEPEAFAGEHGLRPVASGARRSRCACRPAGDCRLRSTSRVVAGSPPARTPTARCDYRTRRVPAAHDCGDAASSLVLGRRSSTGPTYCRRQGARWRRHSRSPSRDHRVDRRGRRHDERWSPFPLRTSGTLARHPPGMTARIGRYAPPSEGYPPLRLPAVSMPPADQAPESGRPSTAASWSPRP